MNFLLIGPPGSGKTTAACTGRMPTLLIDIDKKAREMRNLRPLVEKGDLVIKTFEYKLVEDSLAYRALNPDKPPKTQPQGYVAIVEYLNRILDNDPEFKDFNTIVADSLTRLCEHLKKLLVYHRGQGKFGKGKGKEREGDMNWPSWGSHLSNLEELFYAIVTYLEDKDFICTAHLQEETERNPLDPEGAPVITGYWPMVDGQFRRKMAGYFNEVYYMQARHFRSKPSEYMFLTRGNKYAARTSLPLDTLEEANIKKVLEKGGDLLINR